MKESKVYLSPSASHSDIFDKILVPVNAKYHLCILKHFRNAPLTKMSVPLYIINIFTW